MAERGVIFTQAEADRTHEVVKRAEQQPMYSLTPIRKVPRVRGGADGCQDHFRVMFLGRPTGGDTDIPLSINGVSENVTFDYNETAASMKTALAAHSEVPDETVVETGSPGGSLPYQEMWFYFTGEISMSNVYVGNPSDAFTGGDNPHSLIRRGGNELA